MIAIGFYYSSSSTMVISSYMLLVDWFCIIISVCDDS